MEITTEIHFDKTTVQNNHCVKFDATTFKTWAALLDIGRRNVDSLKKEILEEAISELRGQE